MAEPSLFTESFEFPEGFAHSRCEKPTGHLAPHMHWEMNLPDDRGRAHLDTYHDASAKAIYSRLYSMRTGEVAWFKVARSASHREETSNG